MGQSYREENEEAGGLDVKRLFIKLVRNYKWFLLSIPLLVAGAYSYLHYQVPLYQVTAFVQLQPPAESSSVVGSPFSQKGGGSSSSSSTAGSLDVNGEIFKMQSASLLGEVVDSLHLDIEVTAGEQRSKTPVTIDSFPFTIRVSRRFPDHTGAWYKLVLNDSSFRLGPEANLASGLYDHPTVIQGDTVTVHLGYPLAETEKHVYGVRFTGRAATAAHYLSRLKISSIPKAGVGMLQVSLRDEKAERAQQFIEVLIHRYDLANFSFRNKALQSEMEFLDSRLAAVDAELERQENNVRDFKASNKINDISSSANQLLTNLSTIDSKKNDNAYKESLVNLVEQNVRSSNGREERINVPGLQDADLMAIVGSYNDLVSQKNNILVQGTPNDLRLPPINAKLEDAKKAILNRVSSIRAELKNSNDFLAGQEKNTTGRFVGLPEKEKDYIQVNRLLNIKQSLYVFLLQRKEDINIEYASAGIGATRFVDWRIAGNVQDPKPSILYLAALALGLLLPAGIIAIRFLLNKRIETSEEIYNATSLPIAGEITFEKKGKKGNLPITETNLSPIAEQFRTLRTNIFYINKGNRHKVLMVTSAVSGEGKSFVSMNLANTIAISDRKVVLLEFDLRNPTLTEKLGLDEAPGITNFLENKASVENIIRPVMTYDNLFFISAGQPLSPHPGEVILSHRMQTLFDHLRREFDYIIVDTPPIENVSDALTLARWADSSFFVVRHKYSLRSSLTLFNQLQEDRKLPHPALIINGIIRGDGFNNVYGYGYGDMNRNRKRKKQNEKLRIA